MFYKLQGSITRMDTYREECLKAKRVREGVIELRPVPIRKRKKIAKPWTVYTYYFWSFVELTECVYPVGAFSKEEDAVRYAERKRREFAGLNKSYWVVNNGEPRT